MHVLITGAGGFLGRKLTAAILAEGALAGPDGGRQALTRLSLVDLTAPPPPERVPESLRIDCIASDITRDSAVEALVAEADSIFHLAAVVSGQAEAEFEVGMRVNLDGTLKILEAARRGGRRPRLVFASSLAVFGAPLPEVLEDTQATTPGSSYGTQKAIGELLVNDYSRRGFVDGRALRLPTIVVRPGKPNAAASSFASSIIREPIQGERAVCPVPAETEVWLSSPRAVIANLVHAHELPGEDLGPHRILSLPGITVSVGEMVKTMAAVAGPETLERIEWKRDPAIERIVLTWPARLDTVRARELKFRADSDFAAVVRAFIEDDMAAPAGR